MFDYFISLMDRLVDNAKVRACMKCVLACLLAWAHVCLHA